MKPYRNPTLRRFRLVCVTVFAIAAGGLSGCSEGVALRTKKKTSAQSNVNDPTNPDQPTVPGVTPAGANALAVGLADRAYVISFLAEIFKTGAAGNMRVAPFPNEFAGACDSNYRDGTFERAQGFDGIDANLPMFPSDRNPGVDTNQMQCSIHAETKMPMVGAQSVPRAALSIRACNFVLGGSNEGGNDPTAAIEAAASTAVDLGKGFAASSGGTRKLASLPLPGDAEVVGAYRLFYLDRPMTDEMKKALKGVVGSVNIMGISSADDKKKEAWRMLLLTLCLSPEWQIL